MNGAYEVSPKSWTVIMRQNHIRFCTGQGLTHSTSLSFGRGYSIQDKRPVPDKTHLMIGMSAGKAVPTLTGRNSFPYRIVQTVPFSGHTLSNAFFQQPFWIPGILILPALIQTEALFRPRGGIFSPTGIRLQHRGKSA